jgi:hypothetical protein
MMTPDELKAIMDFLRERVTLSSGQSVVPVEITFQVPTESEMIEAGLNVEGVRRILSVSWWEEMVEDIVETPEMCDPDESPQQVLTYAKDVVSEYIRKWFPLNETD